MGYHDARHRMRLGNNRSAFHRDRMSEGAALVFLSSFIGFVALLL